jgi:hypothetical protein
MAGNVGDFKTVLGFGWKYMRPYWTRLVAGIVLGCLCGLTAAVHLPPRSRNAAKKPSRPRDTSLIQCNSSGPKGESRRQTAVALFPA